MKTFQHLLRVESSAVIISLFELSFKLVKYDMLWSKWKHFNSDENVIIFSVYKEQIYQLVFRVSGRALTFSLVMPS